MDGRLRRCARSYPISPINPINLRVIVEIEIETINVLLKYLFVGPCLDPGPNPCPDSDPFPVPFPIPCPFS